MEELAEWYKQISSFPKLKITEAQGLYKKAFDTQDETLKKAYMEELILGTLYVVYNYIKRNGLELFVSSSYDMNDIISAFNEVWIKKLYNGELLNVDKYSSLFLQPYYNAVYDSLGGEELIVSEQFEISNACFAELLTTYVIYRNKQLKKPFKEVIKELYFSDSPNSWPYYLYDVVVKVIPLLEGIYNKLNFDRLEDLNLGKTKIVNYLRLMISNGLIEPISDELVDTNDMEYNVATDIAMEHFIDDVDEVLTGKREKEIIHERFGLDDSNSKSLKAIAKNQGITECRVMQVEAKALRKLRYRDSIHKYKEENK